MAKKIVALTVLLSWWWLAGISPRPWGPFIEESACRYVERQYRAAGYSWVFCYEQRF